jgi:hypothetical protein
MTYQELARLQHLMAKYENCDLGLIANLAFFLGSLPSSVVANDGLKGGNSGNPTGGRPARIFLRNPRYFGHIDHKNTGVADADKYDAHLYFDDLSNEKTRFPGANDSDAFRTYEARMFKEFPVSLYLRRTNKSIALADLLLSPDVWRESISALLRSQSIQQH